MSATETDPYLAPGARSSTTIRRWVRLAVVVGVVYLLYRAVFTVQGAAIETAVLLLIAEALTLAVFVLRAGAAWNDPEPVDAVADTPQPATTVVVDAGGATPEAVRTTLLSCRRLRGAERVVVADSAVEPSIRRVAERFDAMVIDAPAMRVVADAPATWVLLVRAGDLPLPDALELLAPTCARPDVGVVQLGVEHANPSSFEHDPAGRWSLAPFEHQVIRPSLAAGGTLLWYGDVPAMVRPAALHDAAPESPPVVLGLHAMSLGYRVTMVPRTLARLRGPASLDDSLHQRFEHTAAIRRRAPEAIRLAPPAIRRQFAVALADPLAAVQRFALVVVAALALGLGRLPADGAPIPLAVAAVVAYGVRWQAQRLMGRGRLGRFSVLRSELRSIGVDITFGRGGGARHQRGRLLLLAGMAAAVALSIAVGAVAVWQDSTERISDGAAAVALVLAAGFLITAADVLVDAVARRQARTNHRVRLDLVACRLGEHEGELRDLSLGGVGLVATAELDDIPVRGGETTVTFRIPDADGAWRDVATRAHVAHARTIGDREQRVGLAFADPTDVSLDPVVEFLTIDRRLVALGRRTPAGADEPWPGAA